MAYTKATKDGLVAVSRNSSNVNTSQIEFDLDKGFSLMEMVNRLESNLDTPRPSKCVFLWSGRRQNEKQSLDMQQQRMILEQIRSLGIAANDIAQTKANLFLIPITVRAIIEQKENEVILARRRFLVDQARIDDEITALNHLSEKRQHENDALMIANLKQRAEINLLVSKDKESIARITLIQTVLDNIDFKTLDQALSTYILTTLANPNQATGFQEQKMQGLLEGIIIKDHEAKMNLVAQNAKLKEQEVEDKKKDVENKDFNLKIKKGNFVPS